MLEEMNREDVCYGAGMLERRYQKANSVTLALKATFHGTTIFCLQIVSVIFHHRVNVTSFTRKFNCHKCAKK